jgi:ATP-dependent Clp protease adaptor protein ClpS
MAKEQSDVRERQHTILKEPRRYKVIFLNDDFTPMDFVVEVLRSVFFKSDAEAETLMLKVHHEGQAIVGIYSLDIAKTKVERARSMAEDEHYPLRVEYQPE